MYKRKIRIPAAQFGADWMNQQMAYTSIGNQAAALPTQLSLAPVPSISQQLIQALNLQNNENTGRSFGDFSSMNAGELAATTTGGIASIIGLGAKSTATTGKEATTLSLADISSGIGTGAKMGSAFGPMGTIIGAGVGAAIGLIGRKGEEAEMTSFTDYDEGTLGTGLIGAFSNRKLRRKRKQIRMNAMQNRDAVRGTEFLASEYANEHGDLDDNTFADGGVAHSLAYVDDGELISTPDGGISKVPERGNPTDSNLVSLPVGSKILSDSLKVPGTKKTFAELGEEMMTKRKSKFDDIYAQNAARLNEMNNKTIHDLLFDIQEQVKAKRGIKRKYKNAVIAAAPGDQINPWAYGDDFKYLRNGTYDEGYLNFMRNGVTLGMIDRAFEERPELFSRFTAANPNYRPTVSQVIAWGTDFKPSDFHRFGEYLYDNRVRLSGVPAFAPGTDVDEDAVSALSSIPATSRATTSTTPTTGRINVTDDGNGNGSNGNNGTNWWSVAGDVLTGVAELAPAFANMFTGMPHPVSANYNPYANAIRNTMAGRRYDINPMIRDIQRNRAISNYNASLMNTNTGANLAFRLANANNMYNAIANARSVQNNMNNQYAADYANMLNSLGQQWVNATNLAEDINRRNYANARNMRREGYAQLSEWLQQRRLERNQRNRDNAILTLYGPYLQAGYTAPTLDQYYNFIRRGGNNAG